MIKSKKDLKEILAYERTLYYNHKAFNRFYFLDRLLKESYVLIWNFQKTLRKAEYHHNNKKSFFHLIKSIFYKYKKNKIGLKLGFSIPLNVFAKGLCIYHYGSIAINGNCRVGENCQLHGNNCIGNKGKGREEEYPIIGNNVSFGFGSVAIGNIVIGDNIKIASGAIVCKSFTTEKSILIGVPAKELQSK